MYQCLNAENLVLKLRILRWILGSSAFVNVKIYTFFLKTNQVLQVLVNLLWFATHYLTSQVYCIRFDYYRRDASHFRVQNFTYLLMNRLQFKHRKLWWLHYFLLRAHFHWRSVSYFSTGSGWGEGLNKGLRLHTDPRQNKRALICEIPQNLLHVHSWRIFSCRFAAQTSVVVFWASEA